MYPNWFENWQAELQGLCPSCKRFHSVSSVTKMLLVFSWRQGKKLMLFPPFTVLRASAGWSCLANILLGRGDLKAWWDPSRERNHWEKYKRWLKPLSVHGNCQPPSHQCPQFHWAWLGLPSSWTALFWHSIYPQLYCKNRISYNLKQARCLLKKWRVISLLQKHLQLLHDPIFKKKCSEAAQSSMFRIWINIFKWISNPRRSSEMLFQGINRNCRKSSEWTQCTNTVHVKAPGKLGCFLWNPRMNPCACKQKHFWSHDTARVSAELVFRHWPLVHLGQPQVSKYCLISNSWFPNAHELLHQRNEMLSLNTCV